MTFQAFRRIAYLTTAELDPRSADPIQLCAHIADQPISLFCHPCADRRGSRSILHLRTAKDAGAAKDTIEERADGSMKWVVPLLLAVILTPPAAAQHDGKVLIAHGERKSTTNF